MLETGTTELTISPAEQALTLREAIPLGALGFAASPPSHKWAYRREPLPLPLSIILPFRVAPADYDRLLKVQKFRLSYRERTSRLPHDMSNFYIGIPQGSVPQRAGDWVDVFFSVNFPANIRSGFWRPCIEVTPDGVALGLWFGYIVPGIEWDVHWWDTDLPIRYDGQKFINFFSWLDHPGSLEATVSCQLYQGTQLIYEDSWTGDAHQGVYSQVYPGDPRDYEKTTTQSWDWGLLEVAFPVGQLSEDVEYTYKVVGDFGNWGVLQGEWKFMIKEGNISPSPGSPFFTPDPWRLPGPTLPWPKIPSHMNPYMLWQESPEYFEPNIEFYVSYSFVNLGKTEPMFVRLINRDTNRVISSGEFDCLAGQTHTLRHKTVVVVYEGETPPDVLRYQCEIGHYEYGTEVVDWSWDLQIPLKGYVIRIAFGLSVENAPPGSYFWGASWTTDEGTQDSPLIPLEQSFRFTNVPQTGTLRIDVYDQDETRITDGIPWGEFTLEDGKDYIADFATKTVREVPPVVPPVGKRDPLDTFIRTMEGIRPKCPVGAIETAWIELTEKVIEITPAVKILPPAKGEE